MLSKIEQLLGQNKPNTLPGEQLAGAKPLFLIGAPRSGTTMLARVLNSHPQVLMTDESAVILQLATNIAATRGRRIGNVLHGKSFRENWGRVLESNAVELIYKFYNDVAKQEGKQQLRYWGEKHPHFKKCLHFLEKEFPQAHYVYAIRDPRDTACSLAAMRERPVDETMEGWSRFAAAYEKFIEKSSIKSRVVLVKYEEFVADYEAGAEKLFSQLDLDFHDVARKHVADKKNLDAHQGESLAARGAALIGGKNRTRDFAAESCGRWRRELNAQQQERAQTLFAEFLRKYDYPLK